MSIQRFKVCLDSLLQGGVSCNNPTINWSGLGDVEVSCPAGTNCNCVEIQVPSDSLQKCFTVQVDCDDCDKCPPIIITKCLCDNNDNCGPCETCIDGQCISRCPDKVCDEDRNICVDCTDDNQCSDGKICNAGRCQCPPDKPFEDANGRCVKCKGNGDCPSCTECVDGDCIPKRCGSGECDPDTGDCVDCLSSGNCTKPNQCCKNNKCECCDGFIFNPITGECEEVGSCREDEGCPKCYICIDKECLPRVCPTGYTCIDDECKKICDCDAGPCNKTEACVPFDGTTCFCKKCEGDCGSNSDCGYGCFCDNGTCKPNPCGVTTCADATDCSNGCGCNGGLCIPCNAFECAECHQINGCKCLGNDCGSDPCNKPCVNGADCGDGCGCVNGMCTSCDKLSCLSLECSQALGCDCINNQCADVKGCDNPCSIAGDCDPGCTCYQGKCTPCVDFPCDDCVNHDGCACQSGKCKGGDSPCTEEKDLVLTKHDDRCELEGKLTLNQCCSCDPIEYVVEQTINGSLLGIAISLYKGGVKLSDLEIENEDQYTGSYKVTVTFTNKPTIIKYKTIVPADPIKDVVVFDPIAIPDKAVGMKVKVEISSKLVFASACEYNKALLATFTSSNIAVQTQSGELYSPTCRNPVFTWSKSDSNVFLPSDVFRRVYISKTGQNTYFDTLSSLIPEFQAFKHYKLEVDCSCAKEVTTYNGCDGKLIFCNPDAFTVTGGDCNRIVSILKVDTCEVNHRGPISWEISIKTNAVPSYTPYTVVNDVPSGFGWAFPLTAINSDSPISSVKIKMVGDDCDECTREYTLAPSALCCLDQPSLTPALDCPNRGIKVTVLDNLSVPIADCVINMYDSEAATNLLAVSTTNVSGIASFSNLTIGNTYWFKFADGGCDPLNCTDIQSMTVVCNECVGKSVTGNYNSNSQILNVILSSVDLNNTYTYKVDGNSFANNTAIVLTNGTHQLEVTETFPDTSFCVWTGSVLVNNCGVTVIFVVTAWDSGAQELNITSITGGAANYTVSFGGQTFTNVTTGGITISTVGLSDGDYPLIVTDTNGCSSTSNVLIGNCSSFEGNAVVNCDTGEVLITFNNGVAPYSYILKDDQNNTIAAATAFFNEIIVNIDPNTVGGDWSLTVIDGLGCVDEDIFPVECPCFPAAEFDVTRVNVQFIDVPIDEVTITIGNVINVEGLFNVAVFPEPCGEPHTQPIGGHWILGPSDFDQNGKIVLPTFEANDSDFGPGPHIVAVILTYNDFCEVCRNVQI